MAVPKPSELVSKTDRAGLGCTRDSSRRRTSLVISWFKCDPRIQSANVKAPVVIVQGTHDVRVPVEDGRALAQACPSVDFVLIEGMTHVLSDDPGTTREQKFSGVYPDAERPPPP